MVSIMKVAPVGTICYIKLSARFAIDRNPEKPHSIESIDWNKRHTKPYAILENGERIPWEELTIKPCTAMTCGKCLYHGPWQI